MRRTTAFVFVAALLSLAGCGEREESMREAEREREAVASAYATIKPSTAAKKPSQDELDVRAAADALLAAIDANDARRFASLAVEPRDKAFRALEAKEVEAQLAELHQQYGVRARRVVLEPSGAYALGVAMANVVFGDGEDAIALTFTKLDGAWKLSAIGSVDPATVDPAPASAPSASDPPPK